MLKPNEQESELAPTIKPLIALEPNERESKSEPPIKPSATLEPNECEKGIFCRRKLIGRRKDGKQKKESSYNYQGVRVSHGLHSFAPPQQVKSAVMTNQHKRCDVGCAPLKTELQRDLKKAIANNLKYAASIKCLKKENDIQQNTISLQKEKVKTHVEVCNQLRGEKRSLEKAFHARLKEVGEERSKLKSTLTKENRLLHKSYNAEVQK
jgi:hypothetical protein